MAGAGFAESGSSLDILRESASQGALTKSVMATQGLITEAGYQEQAQSYRTTASAAGIAADAENEAATLTEQPCRSGSSLEAGYRHRTLAELLS